MLLDAQAAAQGIAKKIAGPLKMSVTAAAQAIVDIAVSKMSLAVREVSVAKGYDPRDFVLVASGGAGPLHVLAIARELHIPKVIVPLFPAHFSALGMLVADERHDFIAHLLRRPRGTSISGSSGGPCEEMAGESEAVLRNAKDALRRIHLDLRYVGQEFTLSVPVDERQIRRADRRGIRSAFDRLYDLRYAHHSPGEPVEIVNIRARRHRQARENEASQCFPRGVARRLLAGCTSIWEMRRAPSPARYTGARIWARARASPGRRWCASTARRSVLFKGDVCRVARTGELVISVKGAA